MSQAKTFPRNMHRLIPWLFALVMLLALSLSLAYISTGFRGLSGWGSFMAVALLSAGLLSGAWRMLRGESPPGWLFALTVGAALLRLAVGVTWFLVLPAWGYASPPEQSGYVMADAHERDQAAWELASSGKPLDRAFQRTYHKADQYGGMLYISAAVYRYLGGEVHQPMLIVMLTAAFSSLVLLFTWAFSYRAFGDEPARLASWGLALYPEAVLLGSSQMREAFIITLVAVAFYGLLRAWNERTWAGLAWVTGALLLCLPLSPPVTGLLLLLLVLQALFMGGGDFVRQHLEDKRLLLLLLALTIVILAAVWAAGSQLAPESVSNPLAVIRWWFRKSADWQAHLSQRASGWIQKIFKSTPDWMNIPLLLFYGVVQPFLPAALGDLSGAPIWRGIAIWRALGWTLLLPLLFYAPLRAFRKNKLGLGVAQGLSLVAWLVILLASYRSGGDQWDNPRYRVMFAAPQIALAAWAWLAPRRAPDPWLRRVLVGLGLVLLWFMPWYLRRYTPLDWPVSDLFKTVGLGLASACLYWLWDWAGEKRTD